MRRGASVAGEASCAGVSVLTPPRDRCAAANIASQPLRERFRAGSKVVRGIIKLSIRDRSGDLSLRLMTSQQFFMLHFLLA
jgi:hypothetical protein